MGDVRFERQYRRVASATSAAVAMRDMNDDEVVSALAASARHHDPYLANVLATESLNRVEQKRVVLENMEDGVYAIDASGLVTFMNPAAERLLGWPAEDLVGRDVHAATGCTCVSAPHSRDSCPPLVALATGEPQACDAAYGRKTGGIAEVALTAAPVAREGEVSSVVVVVHDVAARRRHEAAVQRERAQLSRVLRALAHGITAAAIVVFDAHGDVKFANAMAENLFRRSADDMRRGKPPWDLRLLDAATRTPIPPERRPTSRALTTGAPVQGEDIVLRYPDDEETRVTVDAVPVPDPQTGEAAFVVLTLAGVSDAARDPPHRA